MAPPAGRRVVVVDPGTGRSLETAEALVAAGARVLFVTPEADEAERELGLVLPVDVREEGGVDAVVRHVATALDSLDGVVVDAGDPPWGEALTLTDEVWQEAFTRVLVAPIRVLRALLPHLTGGGDVLLVAPAAYGAVAEGAAALVLQAAVAALARGLALQVGPAVRVEALVPADDDGPAELAEAAILFLARAAG